MHAHGVRSFLVKPDELIYVELAQALAARPLDGLEVYGIYAGYTNGVYPALLAPLYALFDPGTAFTAAHLLNAILFASAAIPAILLLRHLGAPQWLGALGGILAVCVPWATATTVLMTEAAAYPAFAWAVFAMTVAVSTPRPRHDALALLAILVASGVRPQFVLLAAVLVLAILVHATTFDRAVMPVRRALATRLRPHAPAAIALAVLALVLLIAGPAVLGSYGGTTNGARLPDGVFTVAAQYVARLSAGLTIVPMILGLAFFLHGLTRPAGSRHYAFALVGFLSALLVVWEAAVFSRNVAGPWMHERYAAYAVIPFIIATVALLADSRRPAPLGTVFAAGAAVGAVASAVTYEPGLPLRGWIVLAPSQGYNDVWSVRVGWLNDLVPGGPHPGQEVLALAVLVLALVLGAALTFRRRNAVAAAILGVLLVFNGYATDWSLDRARDVVNADAAVNSPPDRNWVDEVVGDRRVAVIPGVLGRADDHDEWFSLQFWNTSVTRLYATRTDGMKFGLPERSLRFDRETGTLHEPIDAPLALVAPADPAVGIAGSIVERRRSGVALVELARPQRLTRLLLGTDARGTVSADTELRVYRPAAGSAVDITLEAPPARRSTPWEIRSRGFARRGRLAPSRSVTARLRLKPVRGAPYAAVTIHTPHAPASFEGSELGLRVVSIALT